MEVEVFSTSSWRWWWYWCVYVRAYCPHWQAVNLRAWLPALTATAYATASVVVMCSSALNIVFLCYTWPFMGTA